MNRDILLAKLEKLGFRGKTNELLKSYFDNRKQKVKINENTVSNIIDLKCGIPQGSSISSTLFSLYIDDISNEKTTDSIQLYADDTVTSETANTILEIRDKIQVQANEINEWMSNNNLELNEDKTELIVFHNNYHKEANKVEEMYITLKKKKIYSSRKVKYLGVIIDQNGKWEEQYYQTIKKNCKFNP